MIYIFVNRKAGKGKAVRVAGVLKKMLTEKELPFEEYINEWPGEISKCSEAWIVGGDGTLNFFINRYPGIKVPLGIFKGGTGNDFAWKLYGDISLESHVEKVLTAKPRNVDAARCNEKLFLNVVGIGFDGEVLRSIKTVRWLGGHLGYLLVVIGKIFRFRESRFRIRSGNTERIERVLLLNIANSSRTGGGFLVSPEAEVNDGKLNMMLCKPLSIINRLRYLPVIEKGKHLTLPVISHYHIEEVSIESDKEIFAQVDGELVSARNYYINIIPSALQFKY